MVTVSRNTGSVLGRYAWTVFVLMGALLLFFGTSDLTSGSAYDTQQENALNELFIGLLGIVTAVFGMRRGQRWAWYAMATWPLWIAAQGLLAWSYGHTGEALTTVVMLVLSVSALGLSFGNLSATERT